MLCLVYKQNSELSCHHPYGEWQSMDSDLGSLHMCRQNRLTQKLQNITRNWRLGSAGLLCTHSPGYSLVLSEVSLLPCHGPALPAFHRGSMYLSSLVLLSFQFQILQSLKIKASNTVTLE